MARVNQTESPKEKATGRRFRDFAAGDDDFRDGRFKIIPRAGDGNSWMVGGPTPPTSAPGL